MTDAEEQLLPPTLVAAVHLQVSLTLEPTHVRTVLHFEETIGTVERSCFCIICVLLYHLCHFSSLYRQLLARFADRNWCCCKCPGTRETQTTSQAEQFKGTRHTPCRTRLREDKQVYTGYDRDSAISSVVGVSEDRVQLYVTDDTVDRTERHGKESMAKQEATQMESMLEMFLKMKDDDRKREERREREGKTCG